MPSLIKLEKGESPSLMLKFTRALLQVWSSHSSIREDIPAEQLFNIVHGIRQKIKDTQHVMWLDMDEVKCLLACGRFKQAQELARILLKKKRNDSWAWALFASTFQAESPQAAITCYAKSVMCAHEKQFAFPALKSLASLLAEQGMAIQASMCVKEIVECCRENGWNIKKEVLDLQNQAWCDLSVDISAFGEFVSV